MITVVLADDHPVFREGLRFVLSQTTDITIIGEASDGSTALRLVTELTPKVVIMDIAMPGMGGIEATGRIQEQGMPTRVLMLTMDEDHASVLAALRAGAAGYLLKGADAAQILSATRGVADGHAVFGGPLASRMLDFFALPRQHVKQEGLSAREQEILTYLADGRSNADIARSLVISPITVRNHVSSILRKLQVTDRRQAMLKARGDSSRLSR